MKVEPKEIKTDFEKILNSEMKDLIGTRNWNVWRTDIEPEMYNSILHAMYHYGKKKWEEAQRSANKIRQSQRKDGRYPAATVTPYKP